MIKKTAFSKNRIGRLKKRFANYDIFHFEFLLNFSKTLRILSQLFVTDDQNFILIFSPSSKNEKKIYDR